MERKEYNTGRRGVEMVTKEEAEGKLSATYITIVGSVGYLHDDAS